MPAHPPNTRGVYSLDHERLSEPLYEKTCVVCGQALPPGSLSRAWRRAPDGGAAAHRACSAGIASLKLASEMLSEEWLYVMDLGRLERKAGASPPIVLRHMARACHLATRFHGGRVEPLYRLHATRLKYLEGPKSLDGPRDDLGVLSAVARHCFSDAAAAAAAEILGLPVWQEARRGVNSTSAPTADGMGADGAEGLEAEVQAFAAQLRSVLLEDCREALRFCLDKGKGYHKVCSSVWFLQSVPSNPQFTRELQISAAAFCVSRKEKACHNSSFVDNMSNVEFR